jgi:hypothetical protein
MNTKTATVYLKQDATARAQGIVHMTIVADGELLHEMILKDGEDLARRADAALKSKGFFRKTGFDAILGKLVASVAYDPQRRGFGLRSERGNR